MKVGIDMATRFGLQSLVRVYRGFYESLSARHELVFLPPEYPYVGEAERERMADDFLRRCDVVAGEPGPGLFAARRRLGSDVPFLFFALGDMPMGAFGVREQLEGLTSADVLLVNCASEAEIARRFFRNLRVRVVPFAFDPRDFYPLSAAERAAVRRRLRLADDDRVVLYVGRIALEKSIQTLLGVFDLVCQRVPDALLVLAGPIGGGAALERFGVGTVSLPGTFSRLIARMEMADRVRTPGPCDAARLRELYNVADLKVNLTLNPDENFGLVQLEAMACGTPVVGTAWGGLKDTIVDGDTGWRVSTVPTATGVKLDWWEAANRIVEVLEEDADGRERRRQACLRQAERYSPAARDAVLDEVLHAALRARGRPVEPVRATPFAEEFWSVCDLRWPGAPFRRGPRSRELYSQMVAPFTARSPAHAAPSEALRPQDVVTLATPVHLNGGAVVRPDDAFHPFEIDVPPAHRGAVHAVLTHMRQRPALAAAELDALRVPGLEGALEWMFEAGLLLGTRAAPGWMEPASADGRLAEPVFAVRPVDREAADLLAYA